MSTRKPKQQRAIERRQGIIEAGFVALEQYGLDATIKQIAELADVSVGSLYEYFESKEAINQAMIEQFSTDALARFRSIIGTVLEDSIANTVSNLLREYHGLLTEMKAATLIFYATNPALRLKNT